MKPCEKQLDVTKDQKLPPTEPSCKHGKLNCGSGRLEGLSSHTPSHPLLLLRAVTLVGVQLQAMPSVDAAKQGKQE